MVKCRQEEESMHDRSFAGLHPHGASKAEGHENEMTRAQRVHFECRSDSLLLWLCPIARACKALGPRELAGSADAQPNIHAHHVLINQAKLAFPRPWAVHCTIEQPATTRQVRARRNTATTRQPIIAGLMYVHNGQVLTGVQIIRNQSTKAELMSLFQFNVFKTVVTSAVLRHAGCCI